MQATDQAERFLVVLQTHKGIIYKVAHSYCADAEDRKDLVQDIIVQLWKSFNTYSDQYKYSTWIYRIALNVAISVYRKETRRKPLSQPLSDSILTLVELPVANEGEENLGLLQQFITELKELDKALLLLYLDEKSHREIAEIMGMSETNVSTRIGRIKTVLRQKFSTIKAQ
ncbi:sigma-70 family RNA polymerase sigma factor [Spirosoma migulaei]